MITIVITRSGVITALLLSTLCLIYHAGTSRMLSTVSDALCINQNAVTAEGDINNDKVSGTLVFDVGMNNGDDTNLLLEIGYQVVAVEANPSLVQAGKRRFAQEIEKGRLSIAPVALPLGYSEESIASAASSANFYSSNINNQWSSFDWKVGCRGDCWRKETCPTKTGKIATSATLESYKAPNGLGCCVGPQYCEVHRVPTVDCKDLIDYYGVPYIMKLDVERAEFSCIRALKHYPKKPRILTIERHPTSAPGLFELMRELGYTQYKIVEQPLNHKTGELGVTSGALGALARDCKLGWRWHSMETQSVQYEQELLKHCRRKAPKAWYDWQFRHPSPDPPGLGAGPLPEYDESRHATTTTTQG